MKEYGYRNYGDVDEVALNILQKRYFKEGETKWEQVVKRVVDHVLKEDEDEIKEPIYSMMLNRYFIPNSPTLVNSGTKVGGLSACFVVDFPDSIEGIYKTKLDFALIAKKGGGCGTTLSKIRPEGSNVNGSSHGYAGGPVKFFDTICHDMTAMTQAGFREMAMMGVMSVYHPDIIKFIRAKTEEGKMHTTNISVMVDDEFMRRVENDETYLTYFDGQFYEQLKAREVFNLIVDGAWENGEPGLLFYEKVNDSPYKYSGQEIQACNPCGEQGLPANGVCNLGSIDICKFLDEENQIDYILLDLSVRIITRFLDKVITVNKFPTEDIAKWAEENRPIGIGIMGLADYFLRKGIVYGSELSLKETEAILGFIYNVAEDESITLGEEKGVPLACKNLPRPRRNITLLSIAPTGTIALLAGCSSGIEPIFSEITERKDKTGIYNIIHPAYKEPYFRCAVSSNGSQEVTWEEHVEMLNASQKFVDAGVSKTINFPNTAKRQTIYNAFMYAWKLPYIKGMTVYRNGSRVKEVLSPKNMKKDLCPVCGEELVRESGCKHCSVCDFSVCEIG